jgi:hypothetical protein
MRSQALIASYAQSRATQRERLDAEFFTKVTIVGECWEWKGKRQRPSRVSPGGYGIVRRFGRALFAHRYAYELRVGPIPSGTLILHSCDNPPCVNPDHLSVGTQSKNIADMWARGRR